MYAICTDDELSAIAGRTLAQSGCPPLSRPRRTPAKLCWLLPVRHWPGILINGRLGGTKSIGLCQPIQPLAFPHPPKASGFTSVEASSTNCRQRRLILQPNAIRRASSPKWFQFLSHPDRVAIPQAAPVGTSPQNLRGLNMPLQRANVTITGKLVEVTVDRRNASLWVASGVFADRDIEVVGRNWEDALERWRAAACDDWLAPAA